MPHVLLKRMLSLQKNTICTIETRFLLKIYLLSEFEKKKELMPEGIKKIIYHLMRFTSVLKSHKNITSSVRCLS